MANTRKADGQRAEAAEPAGCLYGPAGPMTADQLTPGDRAAMTEFRTYLRRRREAAELTEPAAELAEVAERWQSIALDPRSATLHGASVTHRAMVAADAAELRGAAWYLAAIRDTVAEAEAEAYTEAAERDRMAEPVAVLDQLGARWSPDFDAYAAGQLDAGALRCVLCGHAPCDCPPFGSPEYLAMVNRLHGRDR